MVDKMRSMHERLMNRTYPRYNAARPSWCIEDPTSVVPRKEAFEQKAFVKITMCKPGRAMPPRRVRGR